jgi:hypothetical protein
VGDNDVLGKIFSAAAGVWAIFLAVVVAIFKGWPAIMGRLNERKRDAAAAEAEDWHRLRAEIDRLHASIANRERLLAESDDEKDELRREKFEWMTRAVTAEATLLGLGQSKQEAAKIVAAERIVEDAKKNGNNL